MRPRLAGVWSAPVTYAPPVLASRRFSQRWWEIMEAAQQRDGLPRVCEPFRKEFDREEFECLAGC